MKLYNFLTTDPFVLMILSALLAGFIYFKLWRARDKRISKKAFKTSWMSSKKLLYKDISELKEYPEKNPSTQSHLSKEVEDALDKCKNILLIGESMAGKAYFTINYLKKLENTFVLIPQYDKFDDLFDSIPNAPAKAEYKIILIDNIHAYIHTGGKRLNPFFEKAKDKGYIIWANTISGNNYEVVKDYIYPKFFSTFKQIIIPSTLSNSEALSIAKSEGISKLPSFFDNNIGSIFYDLSRIKVCYKSFDFIGKRILEVIKQLYLVGLYNPPSFILEKDFMKLFGLYLPSISKETICKELDQLEKNGFVFYSKDRLSLNFEERYIRIVVSPDLIINDFIKDISSIFPNNVFAFNQAIHSANSYKEANHLYKQMLKKKVQPNDQTFAILIRKSKDSEIGLIWLEEMNNMSFNINDSIINSLLYTTQGNIEKREKVKSKLKSYDLDITQNINDAKSSNFKLDVYSYTNLMNLSVDYNKAIELFNEMKNNNIDPDSTTYNVLIKFSNNLKIGLNLLEEMVDSKILPDNYTFGTLMNICESYDEGRKIFDKMTENNIIPNEANYRILMKLSNNFLVSETILQEMEDKQIFMTPPTYGFVINQATNFEEGKTIFDKMIDKGITPTCKEYGTLISKAPDFKTGKTIFDEMKNNKITPTEIEYSTLIKIAPSNDEGKLLLDEMQESGIIGNVEVYGTLISKIKNNDALALKLFKEMLEKGINANAEIYGTLINCSSSFKVGKNYFDEMIKKGFDPTVKTYGTLINLSKDFKIAEELFSEMVDKNIPPNIEIYGTLINLSPDYMIARGYFDELLKNGIDHSIKIYNTLIKKSKNLDIGKYLMNEMVNEKLKLGNSTYGTLMSISYDLTKGKDIFQEMIDKEITPNSITCCSLIKLSKNYEDGKKLLEETIKNVVQPDDTIYGALMSLTKEYTKRKEVLDMMIENKVKPNMFVYSMMIESSSDANIGRKYLSEMIRNNITPTTWIYNSIIKLIDNFDEAIKILRNEMKSKNVLPDVITYSQLMTKSRDFDVSLKLLSEMLENNIKPNEIIYKKISRMAGNNKEKKEKLTETIQGIENILTKARI
ncbi:MAG: hypothetical protein PHD62_04560 [Bacteroidales bacterium]|nr:hypothetical protein [Bacteroidales bacterium]MDD4804959.1 hypothetical protein [Candidatus Paceibacterota bacterium]